MGAPGGPGWLMIAFESDRAENHPYSITSTPTSCVRLGEVISLPWDVFTGPAARQSLHVKSLLGLMRYLFHASLWVWLYSMNNQLDHCKSKLLNDSSMSHLKHNSSSPNSACKAETSTKLFFPLILAGQQATDCHLFQRSGTTVSTCSFYCFPILSSKIWSLRTIWNIQYCVIPMCSCM